MSGDGRLRAAAEVVLYQRAWFDGLRERAARGDAIALVNADVPHEILRAFDIPYVVNQWWSSIIAAKRRGPASLERLRARGLPDASRQYDALPLGAQDLPADDQPWGGLPDPRFVICERGGDAAHRIFELWGARPGTDAYFLSRTGADPVPDRWWEIVPHDWERAFGHDRIDLMQRECAELIGWLEDRTGRPFERDRLREIMDLSNEQAEWNRRTRDLIAAARPTPVAVGDSIPAVMIPQWHRGTEYAVKAARRLHDEVAERIDAGSTVAANERRRLMWVGRGLWYDVGLYRAFEQSHGAVFVWSMYLAIAADGYVRYGPDPLRALAARFVGITDQLYVPPWSTQWYAKEAQTHGVDGVVHLVADDTPGAAFITAELEDAGIPVLEIRANNADPRGTDLAGSIRTFLDERVASAPA